MLIRTYGYLAVYKNTPMMMTTTTMIMMKMMIMWEWAYTGYDPLNIRPANEMCARAMFAHIYLYRDVIMIVIIVHYGSYVFFVLYAVSGTCKFSAPYFPKVCINIFRIPHGPRRDSRFDATDLL